MPRIRDKKKNVHSSGRFLRMKPGFEHLRFFLNVRRGSLTWPADAYDLDRLIPPGVKVTITDEPELQFTAEHLSGRGVNWVLSFQVRTLGQLTRT